MHASFNAQVELRGKETTVAFHRGDLIYTLPDPLYLEENKDQNTSARRTELCTQDMWIAQIADCCVLKTTDPESGEESNLGVLRVRWLYSRRHVTELNDQFGSLHSNYIKPIKSMKFGKYEVSEGDDPLPNAQAD